MAKNFEKRHNDEEWKEQLTTDNYSTGKEWRTTQNMAVWHPNWVRCLGMAHSMINHRAINHGAINDNAINSQREQITHNEINQRDHLTVQSHLQADQTTGNSWRWRKL